MGGTKQQQRAVIAVALALTLGSGCTTTDTAKAPVAKKPDVSQPGVLPPPQAMTQTGANGDPSGGVVQAGGIQASAVPPVAAPAPSMLTKIMARTEKKLPATEMAMGWRNRIEHLPDPARHGASGAGIVGQLFLYGGPKLEFALADGYLTVDLLDETPRPAGQPAAMAERWQFDKETLRKLVVNDETFGKSYALFLPWPAYKPDITKVRISARYDPENGHTLYAEPTTVTFDNSARQWDVMKSAVTPGSRPTQGQGFFSVTPNGSSTPFTSGPPVPIGGPAPTQMPLGGPASAPPIPLGGAMPNAPTPMVPLSTPGPAQIPLGNAAPGGVMMPFTPNTAMPIAPPAQSATGPVAPVAPVGAAPVSAAPMEPLPPLAIIAGQR